MVVRVNVSMIVKECGSSAYCQHGKQKTHCKECGGSALCEHDKIKDVVKSVLVQHIANTTY